jgi:hypothetical protein
MSRQIITITEALAEIPTISKRIEKKQEFIKSYLFRQSAVRDPHEKDGGSSVLIQRELQGIKDLQQRIIDIRSAIQEANAKHEITIEGVTRTIADWLTWRREIASGEQSFTKSLFSQLQQIRQQAQQKGVNVLTSDKGEFSADFVININEKELADKLENLEIVLGTLDGQLSLKNATILIELP